MYQILWSVAGTKVNKDIVLVYKEGAPWVRQADKPVTYPSLCEMHGGCREHSRGRGIAVSGTSGTPRGCHSDEEEESLSWEGKGGGFRRREQEESGGIWTNSLVGHKGMCCFCNSRVTFAFGAVRFNSFLSFLNDRTKIHKLDSFILLSK